MQTNYATPDLEIFVDVFRENFLVGLTLFADLHKRQFKAGFFGGKTCLNPAVGNVIARAANLQPGEVVWDPMCGIITQNLLVIIFKAVEVFYFKHVNFRHIRFISAVT